MLANGRAGLWLEKVDRAAKVGAGVDTVDVVLLVVVDLELEETDVKPPNNVLGDFWKVVEGKVGTAGISRVKLFESTRGRRGSS